MSSSNNMHSKEGFTAWSKQRGITVWVTVEDGEDNDVTFFFKDTHQADLVALAFNYRPTTEAEKIDE